jgi:Fur family transcriptional regulator, ferric uptake regulator
VISESQWEEMLSQVGCRITEPRRAVMQVLDKAQRPLAPQDILEEAQVLHPNLGLVTVYRTLELFEALQLVRRVHRDGGCHGYLISTPGHRHILMCEDCGRAVEFSGQDDLVSLIDRVEEHTGFAIEHHILQLSGLCPACRKTSGSPLR